MTLTSRNSILIGFLLLVTLFFLFFLSFLFYLAFAPPRSVLGSDLYDITETTRTVGGILAAHSLYFVFALAAGFFLKSFFRKTTSPEIFFFILFVFSVAFRGLACFQIYVIVKSLPSSFGVVITRFIIFGDCFGAGCLLCSGIFPTGIQTSRYGIFLGLAALIAVIIATSMPVDASSVNPDLSYAVGNLKELTIVLFVLKILSIVNYFMAGFFKNNKEYLFLGAAVFLAAFGFEIMNNFELWLLTTAGFLALIGGTVLFANRIHSIYMWR